MERTYLLTENGTEVDVGVLAPRIRVRIDNKKGSIYVPFLDESVIKYIAAMIFEMVQDGFDCIIMITGRRRTGKSTLGIQIAQEVAKLVGDTFTLDKVAFRVEDFSEILSNNPYSNLAKKVISQALLDEAGHGLYSKEWYASWQRNMVKCLEVIGVKNEVCYFILPHMRKLTGDIRDEMAHIWIDVDTKYKHARGYAELYMGSRDKFTQSIWWTPKCAFRFRELGDEFWASYTAKKRAFVDEVAKEKIGKAVSTKENAHLNKILYELHKDGMSHRDIESRYGISHVQVCRRIADFKTEIEPQTSNE